MMNTPASAKTMPRATVPTTPSSSTTARTVEVMRFMSRYFSNFRRTPSQASTRLHTWAGLLALAHDAEGRLAQAPQGVTRKSDADDPDQCRPTGVPGQFLHRAALVGLALTRTGRER